MLIGKRRRWPKQTLIWVATEDLETHQAMFAWMLQRLADAGLVKGKTVGREKHIRRGRVDDVQGPFRSLQAAGREHAAPDGL